MTVGSHKLEFFYDASGAPVVVLWNGTPYYYVTSLQGDVVLILDNTGELVVSYDYDAWGNILSTGGSLAPTLGAFNPLRYRGYVYDAETELYYLQSRYYNPEWGRFLNADALVSTGQGELGNNMFAYCGNNPVNRYDEQGCAWKSIWEKVKNTVRTILHNVNTRLTRKGVNTAALGAALLGMYPDSNGIYHASFDCWQQYFGYNDMYDFMFDVGTSMESDKFTFSYDGKSYIVWIWKGDYINLGAGAELGIYHGGPYHWYVDKGLAMKMSLTLKYKGKTIISYSSTTWWITGFHPKYINVSASSLTATFTIWFNDSTMYEAFQQGDTAGWIFYDSSLSAQYVF